MRKTFALVVFYFYLTGAANLIEVTGVAAAWGVNSPVGVTTAVADVTQELQSIKFGTGPLETLIAVFTAVAGTIEAIGRGIFALPLFLDSMGVPTPFTAFLFAPAIVLLGRDIIHAVSGRFQ